MGDVVHMPARRPRGCWPDTELIRPASPPRRLEVDLLMLVAAARMVLDARSRREQSLAIARLRAAVAAHDRDGAA